MHGEGSVVLQGPAFVEKYPRSTSRLLKGCASHGLNIFKSIVPSTFSAQILMSPNNHTHLPQVAPHTRDHSHSHNHGHAHDHGHDHDSIVEHNAAYFDELADKYENVPGARELIGTIGSAMRGAVVLNKESTTVLDFACGVGEHSSLPVT